MTLTLDLTHFLSNWIWNEKIQTFCLLLVLRLCVVCCAVLLCCVVLLWFFFIGSVCQLLHLHQSSTCSVLSSPHSTHPWPCRSFSPSGSAAYQPQTSYTSGANSVYAQSASVRRPPTYILLPARSHYCHRHANDHQTDQQLSSPHTIHREAKDFRVRVLRRVSYHGHSIYIYSFGFWRTSSSVRFGNFRHLGPHPILLNVKENPLF